jgi:hypothetical protein
MFTLKVMVGGETRIDKPGLSYERLRVLLPLIHSSVPDLKLSGPVAVLVEADYGVTHILGSWR